MTGKAPNDWPITEDEVLAIGCMKKQPLQAGKEPGLEVPRLKVHEFEKVIGAKK